MILLIAGSLATLTAAAAVAWNLRGRRSMTAAAVASIAQDSGQNAGAGGRPPLECPICAARAEAERGR